MTPGTNEWRLAHWGACEAADLITVTVTPGIRLAIARGAEEAFHALFDTMHAYHYPIRRGVTGSYNCRKITGGDVLSSHAFGIAVDTNWDVNPYVRGKLITDMPRSMTDRIQEIRTVEGVRVWRWGGDWDHRPETDHTVYDAMHWEIIATLEELSKGIERSRVSPKITGLPTLRLGSRGPAVEELQQFLQIVDDGIFGPDTLRAVRQFQHSRGLTVDGWVGPATWTALLNDLPQLSEDEIPPGKDWNN